MVIALDAMGGDLAPDQIVRGARLAADELESQIAVVGRPDAINEILDAVGRHERLIVRPASEVVEMEDSPRLAVRGKQDSSLAHIVNMVRDGEAQACMSAGNSGAFMALCATRLGTISGIHRPAIAFFLPTPTGPRLILDAGANADCKPIYLQQFGVMGSIYAQHALGLQRPRVGILSIGTEAHKGNELTLAAMRLLQQAPIHFIGNVEGDQIVEDVVDVVVCDGFVGNVVLKVAEGIAGMIIGALRAGIAGSLQARLGALLMRGVFRKVRSTFDYRAYGGAVLLGVNGVCVVGHGKSDANAIRSALLVAERAVKGRVVEHVREACAQMVPGELTPASS